MRVFVKILAAGLIGFLLLCVIGLVWIFFYSRDLPDMKALAKFTPARETRVLDPCLTTASVAIPYESMGNNLRAALSAAEAGEEDQGVLRALYLGLANRISQRQTLSMQISRSMFCEP